MNTNIDVILLVLCTLIIGLIIGRAFGSVNALMKRANLEEIAQRASEISVTKGPLDGGYVRYVSEKIMSQMEVQLKKAGYETGIITERTER